MASLPFRIGSGIRRGADAYLDMQKRAIEESRQRAKAAVEPLAGASRDFAAGIQREPEPAPEKDYVGEYLARNPGQAQEIAKWAKPMDPTQMYTPHPRTDITAPAVAANVIREQSAKEAEEQRRTIRQMPDGSFTNTGTGGEAVVRGGESVGPDIGAPGRGGLSMDTSDEARRNFENNLYGGSPDDRAELEKQRAETRMYEILQRNPFAREQVMADIQSRSRESEAANAYNVSRARGQAEQDTRAELLAAEADIEEEYQAAVRNLEAASATPEEKQRAMAYLEQKRDAEKRRAGIPTEASWNRLG